MKRLYLGLGNNNILHVVECPCGLVVKCKCIFLYQMLLLLVVIHTFSILSLQLKNAVYDPT